ncbi:hypothetical protein CSUI_007064, partial [Cystoisospora suis]
AGPSRIGLTSFRATSEPGRQGEAALRFPAGGTSDLTLGRTVSLTLQRTQPDGMLIDVTTALGPLSFCTRVWLRCSSKAGCPC